MGNVQRPLAAGLDYAARGWAVFPLHSIVSGRCSCRRDCPHPAKHPITRHGVHEATTDQQTIRSWWDRWPWANIGVATGTTSGIVVVDVDPANGGTDSLKRLQTLMGSLPETLTARTGGGGGLHLVYRDPGGPLRNTAGRLPGVSEPLPGIDLRADGGYIVAAPSRHRSGGSYAWINTAVPIAASPAWLRLPARRPFPTTTVRMCEPGSASSYGMAALRAELADVRHAATGDRNNTLNRAAFCLGMLVAGGELEEHLVEDELLAAALDVGLPEGEARASVRSGLRAGAREPRRRPAS